MTRSRDKYLHFPPLLRRPSLLPRRSLSFPRPTKTGTGEEAVYRGRDNRPENMRRVCHVESMTDTERPRIVAKTISPISRYDFCRGASSPLRLPSPSPLIPRLSLVLLSRRVSRGERSAMPRTLIHLRRIHLRSRDESAREKEENERKTKESLGYRNDSSFLWLLCGTA